MSAKAMVVVLKDLRFVLTVLLVAVVLKALSDHFLEVLGEVAHVVVQAEVWVSGEEVVKFGDR